jgi:hypothetical protein
MKIKKITLILLIILVIGLITRIIYLKSDYYNDIQAFENRDETLKELDSRRRFSINEGVYLSKIAICKENTFVDNFGKKVNTIVFDKYIILEIQFTSKKLTIINSVDEIKEEIYFEDRYEINPSINCTDYTFFVKKWLATSLKNNELIGEIRSKGSLQLSVTPNGEYHYKRFKSSDAFRSIRFGGFRDGNDCYQNEHTIFLDRVEHLYKNGSNYTTPAYVSSAKYINYVYDLNNYKKPVSIIGE